MTELANSFASKSAVNMKGTGHALCGQQKNSRPKIGMLLIESGLITPSNLNHALQVADESRQPIGRLLVGLGYASQLQIESALFGQTLVCEGTLSLESAISAIRESSRRKVNLKDLMKDLDKAAPTDDGELGGLLLGSGMISDELYEIARIRSEQAGLPLGRTLLLTQGITTTMLDAALTVLVMIRDCKVNRQQGLLVLRYYNERRVTISDALRALRVGGDFEVKRVRIGELLCSSKLISDQECLWSLESALSKKCSLGAILVNSGILTLDQLDGALDLQSFVNSGAISASQAALILSQAKATNNSIPAIANSLGLFRESAKDAEAMELCFSAQILQSHTVQAALAQTKAFGMDASKAVLAAGCLRASVFEAAIELQEMLRKADINADEAIAALKVCQQNNVDAQVALAKLGFVAASSNAENKKTRSVFKVFAQTIAHCFCELLSFVWLALALSVFGFVAYHSLHVDPQILIAVAALIMSAAIVKLGVVRCRQTWSENKEQEVRLVAAQGTKARLSRRGV